MKLGKKPARPDAIQFKFKAYFDTPNLPTPPTAFGRYQAVQNWGVLGNNDYGDCVWAGAAHETMLWHSEVGAPVEFNDAAVLANYTAVTGFDPKNPDTDQGTDMQLAASYRRQTGLLDATGERHNISAYVATDPGNLDNLATACYLFGAVGVGIVFPISAMLQFNMRQPWDVVEGAREDGGHYVSCVGRNEAGNLLVVTWGKIQEMTPAFFTKYNDENVVYLSMDMIKNNVSPDNVDLESLQKDLAAL